MNKQEFWVRRRAGAYGLYSCPRLELWWRSCDVTTIFGQFADPDPGREVCPAFGVRPVGVCE